MKSIRICCVAVNFPRPRHVLCRTVTSSFRKVPLLLRMTPKREKVGDFKYFNPGERLLKAAILVDVFSATCTRKTNDSGNHSRPQRLRSIWPAPWIETSGRLQFSVRDSRTSDLSAQPRAFIKMVDQAINFGQKLKISATSH